MTTVAKKPRLWPALASTALWLAAIAALRVWPDIEGQSRVLGALSATAAWLLLLLLWMLLFSRLRWRTRLAGIGAIGAAVLAATSLFRFGGVTGDVRPIFEPRWRAAAEPPLPATLAPSAQDPAVAPEAAGVEDASADAPSDAVPGQHPTSHGDAGPEGDPPSLDEAADAADFPQFLGPHRDGHVAVELDPDWSARPPRELWRIPVGLGWSGFAVSGGRAVTLEQHDDQDWARAYDLASGAPLWQVPLGGSFSSAIAGDGPRATPSIDGGVAFVFSSVGVLAALDLGSGHALWRRDTAADAAATPPEWGYAGSPLVLGDRVVVTPGGPDALLVAYDRASGEPVARGGSDPAAYSSPFVAELGGESLVVSFNTGSVTGHDPVTLAVRFRHLWPGYQPNVAQPLPLGDDRLLVSAGYGAGAEAIRVLPGTPELVVESLWRSPRLKAKFTNVVLHEGFVYGLDDGVLVCLDPTTGERRWRAGRYGHGQVLLAGDLLLVQTEDGELVLVDPEPDRLHELARYEVISGKLWNSPALAPPVLLVRSHREAVALELPLRGPESPEPVRAG